MPETINKSNYQLIVKKYIAVKNNHLKHFRELLFSYGLEKEKFDFSSNSLVDIWKLIYPRIKIDPNVDYKNYKDDEFFPVWLNLKREDGTPYIHNSFDYNSAVLIDGMAYYFGEVFIKNDNCFWNIPLEKYPKAVNSFLPKIAIKKNNINVQVTSPIWVTVVNAMKAFKFNNHSENNMDNEFSEMAFLELYQYLKETKIEATPPPPPESEFKDLYPNIYKKLEGSGIYELDELIDVENIPKEEQTEDENGITYNKLITITEGFEHIFGEEMFERLEEFILNLDKKIKAVIQTDRELFEVKTSMGKKTLQKAFLEKLEAII